MSDSTIIIAWFFCNGKGYLVSETTMFVLENCQFCCIRQNAQFENCLFVQKRHRRNYLRCRRLERDIFTVSKYKRDQHFFISRM